MNLLRSVTVTDGVTLKRSGSMGLFFFTYGKIIRNWLSFNITYKEPFLRYYNYLCSHGGQANGARYSEIKRTSRKRCGKCRCFLLTPFVQSSGTQVTYGVTYLHRFSPCAHYRCSL